MKRVETIRNSAAARGAGHSLAFRLAVATLLIMVAVSLATIFAANKFGRAASDDAFDRLLRGAALQIAERISVSEGAIVVDLPVSAFELLSLAPRDRVFYRIVDPGGSNLTGYGDLPLPGAKLAGGEAVYDARYKGVSVRVVALARQLAERSISGQVIVVVAQTTQERAALARSILTQAIAVIITAGIALLLLSFAVLRIALRPLARLERLILTREADDLSAIDFAAPREVAVLVAAINRFMGRLDRRVTAMQHFIADAAHQIRTPITAIRAQAQLALDETDKARLARLNGRIHARSVALGRLADQLLTQALVSHRADAARREPIDLRKVVVEAEAQRVGSGDGRRGHIAMHLPDDPVLVRGDGVSLREAVKNLVNNAMLHGNPPVAVTVVLAPPSGQTQILVRDAGAGIDPAIAGEIGTRFVKGDVAAGGAGLGLSIVHDVAESHGGRLDFQRDADGFVAVLALPLAEGVG